MENIYVPALRRASIPQVPLLAIPPRGSPELAHRYCYDFFFYASVKYPQQC